jgi:hypothetical protein
MEARRIRGRAAAGGSAGQWCRAVSRPSSYRQSTRACVSVAACTRVGSNADRHTAAPASAGGLRIRWLAPGESSAGRRRPVVQMAAAIPSQCVAMHIAISLVVPVSAVRAAMHNDEGAQEQFPPAQPIGRDDGQTDETSSERSARRSASVEQQWSAGRASVGWGARTREWTSSGRVDAVSRRRCQTASQPPALTRADQCSAECSAAQCSAAWISHVHTFVCKWMHGRGRRTNRAQRHSQTQPDRRSLPPPLAHRIPV